jgi:hypothetical protein
MATIISQIILDGKRMMEKYGKKLQITLVTDHGNRRGVDHFVKMICWPSVDDQGKHILRHFNLDIEKEDTRRLRRRMQSTNHSSLCTWMV